METTRQQRFWDWASNKGGTAERVGTPYLHLAVKALALTGGESLLDVGCGTGIYFKALQPAVGPSGRIVGVEFSPKMRALAERRIAENGWQNVEVRAGDATKDDLGFEEYDVAVANTSLSAMTDAATALDSIYRALRPGGKLYVTDVQPSGLFRAMYRLFAKAPGEEVASKVKARFDHVDLLDKNADPMPWRDKPMWFTLMLAKKT